MGNLIDLETARRIRAANNIPSYEPDILKVLLTNDDLGAVVRAHIYVEYRIGQLLQPYPPPNDRGERKLSEMIALAQSKHIIDADDASALRALNRLRNEFAHKIDYELTQERLETFVASLGDGIIREMYDESRLAFMQEIQSPGRERQLLRMALCAIDIRFAVP